MPTHDECRNRVCILCLGKTKDMRRITDDYWTIIEEHVIQGLSRYDDRLPTVLCTTCIRVLRDYDKGIFSRQITVFDHSLIVTAPQTRQSSKCSCLVCAMASSVPKNIAAKTAAAALTIHKVGRPSASKYVSSCSYFFPSVSEAPTAIKICSHCFSLLAKGKSHVCSKSSRLQNMEQLLECGSPKFKEKVASNVIKRKMEPQSSTEREADSSSKDSSVKLATATGRSIVLSPFVFSFPKIFCFIGRYVSYSK